MSNTSAPRDRRSELVEATLELIARDGIAAVSTRAVAREAGMPPGTFHYWFKSVNQLLTALSEFLVRRDTDIVGEALERALRSGADIASVTHAVLRAYWSGVERFPDSCAVSYQLTQHLLTDPDTVAVARGQQETYLALAETMVKRVAEQCDVHWPLPSRVLARMTIAFLDGLTLEWVVDRNTTHTTLALDAFADSLARLATVAPSRKASS